MWKKIRSILSLFRMVILFPLVEISAAYAWGYFMLLVKPAPVYSVSFLTVWIYGFWYVLVLDHVRCIEKVFGGK